MDEERLRPLVDVRFVGQCIWRMSLISYIASHILQVSSGVEVSSGVQPVSN